MNAVKVRVILDTKEDVFRDIELKPEQNLEDLHHNIVRSFALQPGEMASFYKSDEEWNQGDEVPYMDMGLGKEPVTMMRDTPINEALTTTSKRLLYVYDFFNMWTFFVEYIDLVPVDLDDEYPRCTYNFGSTPEDAPSKDFSGKAPASGDIFGNAFGDEDDEQDDVFDEGELWN